MAYGYEIDPIHGFVVYISNSIEFPVALTADELTPIIWKWLKSLDYSKILNTYNVIPMNTWTDHDGDCTTGWMLYNQSWGTIGQKFGSVFAVAPAFLWKGK